MSVQCLDIVRRSAGATGAKNWQTWLLVHKRTWCWFWLFCTLFSF